MNSFEALQALIRKTQDQSRARQLQSFFKTGKGHYSEHDKFLGIYIPVLRQMAKNYRSIERSFIGALLESPYNEERLLGMMILHQQFLKGDRDEREKIIQIFLKHLRSVNNWNLVDFAGQNVFGSYFLETSPDLLSQWVQSHNLWERRLAIVSTHPFIKANNFHWTFKMAEQLMHDEHDLIHKAVGWMLREVGKRDQNQLETFLNQWATHMPRTMLRYALERFDTEKRRSYMNLKP